METILDMIRNNNFINVLFNFIYQIKKSIKNKSFNFNIFWYSRRYFIDNLKERKYHLDVELPWITYQSMDYIKSNLKNNSKIFEFGSGGSTLFYFKFACYLISVEHDCDWYLKVKSKIENINSDKYVELILKKPFKVLNENYLDVNPGDLRIYQEIYKDYTSVIDSFPDDFFDLIVIDGKARIEALKKSLNKLKPEGFLIFDNADRKHYQNSLKSIESWLVLRSYGPTILDRSFNQTNIYQKPKN